MFDGLKTAVISGAKTVGLTLIDKAPVLMFAGGVALFGATVYFAVKAAPKVDEALKKHNEEVQNIDEKLEKSQMTKAPSEETEDTEEKIEYTKKQHDKDIRKTYVQTIKAVGKAVALPAICAVTSISLFGGAIYLPIKAGAAATARYLATKQQFEDYRAEVRTDQGAEKDEQYMFKTKTVENPNSGVYAVNPDGTKEELPVEEEVAQQNDYFWHWCEDTSPIFSSAEIMNDELLVMKQRALTEKLAKCHVITNKDILSEFAMFGEIKKDPISSIKFGKKWKGDEGADNEFRFEIHKIWVPDYKKGRGRQKLIYELRYDEEAL